jgi:hypothetical protein
VTRVARFVALWLLALGGSANAADDGVAGIWSSVGRTKGGLGTQWTFGPGGSAVYTFGAVVDFRYEISGNKVTTTLVQPDGTAAPDSETGTFLVEGDTLTMNPDRPERQQMTRTPASPGKSGLVGEWTYKHYTGGPAFMRYSSNGAAQLVVPMKTSEGSYRLESAGGSIALGGQQYGLLLRNDSLVVRDPRGRESAYKRFGY